MNEKPKFRYKSYNLRMDLKTWKKFRKENLKSGLTWNLFIYNLIKKQ